MKVTTWQALIAAVSCTALLTSATTSSAQVLDTVQSTALVDFTVSGTFQYQDRIWDKDGYTGTTQDLPVRFADVEIVNAGNSQVLGSGSTDNSGEFAISVSAAGAIDIYARVLSSSDESADYHITVSSNLSGSSVHSVPTDVTLGHDPNTNLDLGTWVLEDTDGTGVAQAFNIFDCAIDGWNWLSQPQVLNRFPTAGEFVVFRWSPTGTIGGSFYSGQRITIASPGSGDTDGWADTVILHEFGHYVTDVFHQDDNPGGSHFLGDNAQNPTLSYGEGYATYLCAEAREYRAATTGTDDHVSLYADLPIPPAVGVPGGLEFSYDFETGLLGNGTPLGQVGQANETNITSAMWDLFDGSTTPDESPGSDDDGIDGDGSDVWNILRNYMRTLPGAEIITFEDFYQGWKALLGPTYQAAELDVIVNDLNSMGFETDAFELDDTIPTATVIPVPAYNTIGVGGGVVINEIELSGEDAIELYNSSNLAIDISNWQIVCSTNTASGTSNLMFTFPSYVLGSGAFVYVRERGNAANNTDVDLYGGAFSVPWANGAAGACELYDDGGTAIDFVRWDGVGDPSTTPIPAGLNWTGNVASPAGGMTLGRDASGTDTDDAADWSEAPNSGTQPNALPFTAHTSYDVGDTDHLQMSLETGKLYSLRTFALYGAADTFLEILDVDGTTVLGSNEDRGGLLQESRLTFVAPATGDYYARISHVGEFTSYGMYSVRAYEHPTADALLAPLSVRADAQNSYPLADPVAIRWLNGSLYDSVGVHVTGPTSVDVTTAGSATLYEAALDQGVHTISVEGYRTGQATAAAEGWVYAGRAPTSYLNDFADSALPDWGAQNSWALTSSVAFSSPTSVTDSPSGNYGDALDSSLELRVPTQLGVNGTLSFQHICITEATYDFGYVEISSDEGMSWDVLAFYDMDDHPGWNDGDASNLDWIEESISLAAYDGQRVRIRFRLVTDAFVTEDGWYIDDLRIESDVTNALAAPLVFALQQNEPNPFNPVTEIRYSIARSEDVDLRVYDLRGRLVRSLVSGQQEAGTHRVIWNGRDERGSRVASGVYFYRLEAGTFVQARKLVVLK